jgi:choline dehydrogenase
VLPYFKRAEDQERGADDLHGTGGPLGVSDVRLSQRGLCDAFIAACAEAGIPRTDDFNGPEQEGAGYYQLTNRNGRRCSTAVGYLNPVRSRRNLAIVTDALVQAIELDGRRATGVRCARNGRIETIAARREVILAAGAIGSPQILQLSGIGPGAALQAAGVPVRHDLAGVGQNLQDHLQVRCAYKVAGVKTMNERFQSLVQRASFAAQYVLTRRGPMTMAPSQLGAFVKSDPSRETPNLQYHIQPLTLPKFGEPLDPFPAFTASVANIRPTSRGWVRITSPNADAPPEIRPNYLSTADDRHVAAEAIRVTRNIVSMPALAKYFPEEFRPGLEVQGDDELAKAAGDIATTIFHPVGTAKMGSDPEAVVDPRLRVRGLQGLRVADASIMPTITSGNTNAPTLMIAEKAAAMILEDACG